MATQPRTLSALTCSAPFEFFVIYGLRHEVCRCDEGIRRYIGIAALALFISTISSHLSTAFAFEGRIAAFKAQGSRMDELLYTAGTNFLRVENTSTNWPNPVDIWDGNSGGLTLLFPHNRTFVRLKAATETVSSGPPGFPAMPHGVGPQPRVPIASPPISHANPAGMPDMPQMPVMSPQTPAPMMPGATRMPAMPNMTAGGGMPSMPTMPMMPPPMIGKMELTATGDKTNLLGFECEKFEIRQSGEIMEIWATDKLCPFEPYQQNQPNRFGSRTIEEQWGDLLKAKKLFPLRAVLRFERIPSHGVGTPPAAGPERYRFEVKSVMPEALTDDSLFQPPSGYQEVRQLPF